MLSGKVAIVTGAARGIGAAVALAFAKQGAGGVVIADVDIASSQLTADYIFSETGCRCIAVRADVTNEDEVKKVFEVALEEFGKVDIVVNNAGICRIVDIDNIQMKDWDRTFDINLKGTFLFSREALKVMKPRKYGKIINIASQAGKIGGLMAGPDYSASKAGIICLTKTLAKNAAPYSINVNSVAPGLIGTEMTHTFGYDEKSVPLGRIGTPEEVAGAVLFLASDMAGYITGACIDVNGGMTMW